jgi:xylulokinase
MWLTVKDLIKQLNAKITNDPVSAVSVSTFGESFVPIDKKDNILSNIILPGDARSKELLEHIIENLGLDVIYDITGLTPSYLYSLSKIIWIKKYNESVYSKTAKFLLMEDMFYKLLGMRDTKISYSLSSRTMFFDITQKQWSKSILDKLNVDIDLFSEPKPSGTVIGVIPRKEREELGFIKGKVYLIIGGHDQPCVALGSGVIKNGMCTDGVGTVECLAAAFDRLIINDKMKKNYFCCEPHALSGLYLTTAFNMTAGSLIKWYKNTIGRMEFIESVKLKKDFYNYIYSKLDDKPSDLLVFPYFGPSATPYFYNKPLGTIMGLSLETRPDDILKAILEGLVYEIKYNLQLLNKCGIEVGELRSTGGGSRSDYWMQIKSNILGIPVYRMKIDEAGCLGAFLLCSVATGIFKDYVEAIGNTIKIDRVFEPKLENIEKYSSKYEKYTRLFDIIKDILS